jgi:hypothetical protein
MAEESKTGGACVAVALIGMASPFFVHRLGSCTCCPNSGDRATILQRGGAPCCVPMCA